MEFLAAVFKLVGLVIILIEMVRFSKNLDNVEITDFLTAGLVFMAVGIVMSKRQPKEVPIGEIDEDIDVDIDIKKNKDINCKFFEEGNCSITGTKVLCNYDDCGFIKMKEAVPEEKREKKEWEELPGFGR